MRKNKLSPIQKLTGEKGNVCQLPFDYFNLWCCDCNLRHQVFIEKVDVNTIRICMVRDDTATMERRALGKLKKRYTKLKNKGLDSHA